MAQTIQKYTRVAKKGNKFTYSTIHESCYNNKSVLPEQLGDHFSIDFMPLYMSDQVDNALSILETHLNKYHDHFFPVKTIEKHLKFI